MSIKLPCVTIYKIKYICAIKYTYMQNTGEIFAPIFHMVQNKILHEWCVS